MPSRGKLAKGARSARNLAVAEAALALARDRMASKLPGVQPRRRRPRARTVLLGGAVAAAAAAVVFKRDKVAGLLSRGEEPAGAPTHSPGPSNYDVRGPVANTATPVPAPEGTAPPALDEAAEEAAAAAEAANIGGTVVDYAATEPDLTAPEPDRPLAESGEGEAEGKEQTEAELAEAAEPTAPGVSDQERQIDDAIETTANPAAPEQVEPLAPTNEPGEKPAGDDKPDDDSEFRTWSGRAVDR